jgi:predicted nuclease of predicted toxin-antitoxin system
MKLLFDENLSLRLVALLLDELGRLGADADTDCVNAALIASENDNDEIGFQR